MRQGLVEKGEPISRTRVARLRKQRGLKSKSQCPFKATTNAYHGRPATPNRLGQEFRVDHPDTVYVGDIIYIPTEESWLYLAVFIDLYSRAVVGGAMSKRMTTQLVNDALLMAIWKRQPPQGLLAHSDQGSQYASDRYQKTLKNHGFMCSMGRQGCCWDNAPSESFFHTLKTELAHHRRYQTREKAQTARGATQLSVIKPH
ncbi:IS3 family transposase [Nitrosococcus oceani]|uniref:IS3 family transposase n=1 Tax=Nitrosococcus oceani TaxID=1229 RepID=UPI0009D68559|nr:IS3 family transposase [Nitrosococcus oceani]